MESYALLVTYRTRFHSISLNNWCILHVLVVQTLLYLIFKKDNSRLVRRSQYAVVADMTQTKAAYREDITNEIKSVKDVCNKHTSLSQSYIFMLSVVQLLLQPVLRLMYTHLQPFKISQLHYYIRWLEIDFCVWLSLRNHAALECEDLSGHCGPVNEWVLLLKFVMWHDLEQLRKNVFVCICVFNCKNAFGGCSSLKYFHNWK